MFYHDRWLHSKKKRYGRVKYGIFSLELIISEMVSMFNGFQSSPLVLIV